MNKEKLRDLTEEQADALLVERAAEAMTEKLALCRAKGRGGWGGATCRNSVLRLMLVEHVEKGDMVDVLNLAAMILVRDQIIGDGA